MASTKKQQPKHDDQHMSVAEAEKFLDQWAAWVNERVPIKDRRGVVVRRIPRWQAEQIAEAVRQARLREKQRHGGRPAKVDKAKVLRLYVAYCTAHQAWKKAAIHEAVAAECECSPGYVERLIAEMKA